MEIPTRTNLLSKSSLPEIFFLDEEILPEKLKIYNIYIKKKKEHIIV